MTVFVDPLDPQDPHPSTVAALRSWAAEGLGHHTTSALHARRWITNFESDREMRFPAIEVARTTRKGRFRRYPRKPKPYESALGLRVDLINQDVRLESAVCRHSAFLGSTAIPTVYSGSWFLLQSEAETSFTLVCPCGGTRARFDRELDFTRMAWCQSCRYGAVPGEGPLEAGARAFEAVDEGVDALQAERENRREDLPG